MVTACYDGVLRVWDVASGLALGGVGVGSMLMRLRWIDDRITVFTRNGPRVLLFNVIENVPLLIAPVRP
jgi:hypothetical protein